MKKVFLVLAIGFIVESCTKVPISGRRQLNLLPESTLLGMSFSQYNEFLNTNNVLPDSDPRTREIKDIGAKMAKAVEKYLTDNKQAHRFKGFEWTFNLVDDPTVNAWCMPGGKVVFYTGILPYTQDANGIAVVMGHEIAHAVARHGNERMSQQMAIAMGGMALSTAVNENPEQTNNLFLASYGVATGLGSLHFSRNHESEADKLGLIFMAMAGYNPESAVSFWQRMAQSGGGGSTPEMFRTHPSDERRIKDIQNYLPQAMKYYKPA